MPTCAFLQDRQEATLSFLYATYCWVPAPEEVHPPEPWVEKAEVQSQEAPGGQEELAFPQALQDMWEQAVTVPVSMSLSPQTSLH